MKAFLYSVQLFTFALVMGIATYWWLNDDQQQHVVVGGAVDSVEPTLESNSMRWRQSTLDKKNNQFNSVKEQIQGIVKKKENRELKRMMKRSKGMMGMKSSKGSKGSFIHAVPPGCIPLPGFKGKGKGTSSSKGMMMMMMMKKKRRQLKMNMMMKKKKGKKNKKYTHHDLFADSSSYSGSSSSKGGKGSKGKYYSAPSFFCPETEAPTLSPTTSPTTSPTIGCDPLVAQCCETSDCVTGEICETEVCIQTGSLRFTLTWTGNDELDIYVTTPGGFQISFLDTTDPLTGGTFTLDSITEGEDGMWVDNIVFPTGGTLPIGPYTYFVESFQTFEEPDEWLVSVYRDEVLVATQSGSGLDTLDTSEEFAYVVLPPTPI